MLVISRQYEAFLDTFSTITFILPYAYHGGHSSRFALLKDGREMELQLKEKIPLDDSMKYTATLSEELDFGITYDIVDEHGTKTDLQIGAVIRTEEFDRRFYYDGNDLGVTLHEGSAVFKVWSPTSTEVKLKLKGPQDEEPVTHSMNRGGNGVWELTINRDAEGLHYTFMTCINLVWNELVDPYAKSVSYNSEWGYVVDPERIGPVCKPLKPLSSPVDAIIYELNVRDFSSAKESGMKFKGKYLAFTEKDPSTPNGYSSGIKYLKELGITHVELLPVNDFDGVSDDPRDKRYNWGYNPLNFNAPEGSYSMKPDDPSERIRELKAAIGSLHEENIRVILDVVYNHVFVKETSSFEKLVPGYFFRHDENGLPSNGTGVGNDFASERAMARKFIKDSIMYWIEAYGVDGFRFDLMGILDITTMKEIREEVNKILPGAILIGEGWDLNTPLPANEKANLRNAHHLEGIGQFNDCFRDTIKGSTFNLYDKGFALGHGKLEEKVEQVVTGSIGTKAGEVGIFKEPVQSVNYVESHDNHTLWDKMKACLEEDDGTLKKRHKLATSMVIFSQGVPFIHAGQEFFRTKKGIENSYDSPIEVNQLDWLARERYSEDIDYVRELISIRKSHGALRLGTTESIRKYAMVSHPSENLVQVHYQHVHSYGPWKELLLLFHSGTGTLQIPLPQGEAWTILVDGNQANVNGLGKLDGDSITVEALSSNVLVR
ncbi:type I pullulanase [Rossellomorea aquimaris]|uniref:type I pullulanase n=1 Tax=Rossellomorea aquimaris TaxID=189382 RepID=UPI001CD7EE81|nr:type I pullulanase [Rossellomorea aquimaris]MCA1056848.1 type I pullulanase [Rossellomorea aquimaris]